MRSLPLNLSNRRDVQIFYRIVVSEIRGHQGTATLKGRCCYPGVRSLDRLSGAPALIHNGCPDSTRDFIGIESQEQRHVLVESGSAGRSPVVGCGP